MSWKHDLGGWTTPQDDRRRQRLADARLQQQVLNSTSGANGARRHVSFLGQPLPQPQPQQLGSPDGGRSSGGGFRFAPGLFANASVGRDASSSFAAARLNRSESAHHADDFNHLSLVDSSVADLDETWVPPQRAASSREHSPAMAARDEFGTTEPVWVAVAGARPVATDDILLTLRANYGPVCDHVWPRGTSVNSNVLHVRFASHLDAHRAVLCRHTPSQLLQATLEVTWCRDGETLARPDSCVRAPCPQQLESLVQGNRRWKRIASDVNRVGLASPWFIARHNAVVRWVVWALGCLFAVWFALRFAFLS